MRVHFGVGIVAGCSDRAVAPSLHEDCVLVVVEYWCLETEALAAQDEDAPYSPETAAVEH